MSSSYSEKTKRDGGTEGILIPPCRAFSAAADNMEKDFSRQKDEVSADTDIAA